MTERAKVNGLRAIGESLWRSISALFQSEAADTYAREPTHALTPGLDGLALAEFVRRRFYEDREWARARRAVWSARSTLLRFLMFSLSVLAIIFLGVSTLDGFAVAGFVCTAVGTAAAALESFFNWRSRWVAADAALARWHAIEESLALYVASTAEADLDRKDLLDFDASRREVWSEMSQRWLSERNGKSLPSDE